MKRHITRERRIENLKNQISTQQKSRMLDLKEKEFLSYHKVSLHQFEQNSQIEATTNEPTRRSNGAVTNPNTLESGARLHVQLYVFLYNKQFFYNRLIPLIKCVMLYLHKKYLHALGSTTGQSCCFLV